MSHAQNLLGRPLTHQLTQAEQFWRDHVLVRRLPGHNHGFKDDANPGLALVKFFEYYSTAEVPDGHQLDIAHVVNPAGV